MQGSDVPLNHRENDDRPAKVIVIPTDTKNFSDFRSCFSKPLAKMLKLRIFNKRSDKNGGDPQIHSIPLSSQTLPLSLSTTKVLRPRWSLQCRILLWIVLVAGISIAVLFAGLRYTLPFQVFSEKYEGSNNFQLWEYSAIHSTSYFFLPEEKISCADYSNSTIRLALSLETDHKSGQKSEHENNLENHHIQIWYPKYTCKGIFVLQSLKNRINYDFDNPNYASKLTDDTLLIREVLMDSRRAARRFLPSPSHTRVLVLVSSSYNLSLDFMRSSAGLISSNCNASSEGAENPRSAHLERIQFISEQVWNPAYHKRIGENYYMLHIILSPGVYVKTDRIQLYLTATSVRVPDYSLPFTSFIELGCATSWYDDIPRNMPPVYLNSKWSTGAIVFSGNVFGDRQESSEHVADFIMRQLMGPTRFDNVAIPFPVRYSTSQIISTCGMSSETVKDVSLHDDLQINPRCASFMHSENIRSLVAYANDVEKELLSLGAPAEILGKVVFFPYCWRGTLYNGQEARNECEVSRYHGQHLFLAVPLLLFGPFFRWTASIDLDEFFAPGESSFGPRNALQVFEQLHDKRSSRDTLLFPWNNVYTPPTLKRSLSEAIVNKPFIEFVLMNSSCVVDSACYKPLRVPGKTAALSESAMWYNVHKVYKLKSKAMHVGDIENREFGGTDVLRTWHARATLRPEFQDYCIFTPREKERESDNGLGTGLGQPDFICDPAWDPKLKA